MGFTIERRGFTKINDMMPALIADMKANGFSQQFPDNTVVDPKDIVLKAGPNVDPLSETQPWCVRMMWDRDPSASGSGSSNANPETSVGGRIDMLVAPPEQFPAGKCASYKVKTATGADGTQIEYLGLIGTMTGRSATAPANDIVRQFFDRSKIDVGSFSVYPLCYRLSISDRGFALAVWEQSTESTGNRFSWIVVQRPVDNQTGQVIVTGKAPVHCMYGLMAFDSSPSQLQAGRYNIRRFIVREADVISPYPRQGPTATPNPSIGTPMMGADATRNTLDFAAVINPVQQVSISENNKYVVTFPNGFNTARHSYTHELDMVAYTGADVVSQGTEIPLSVYGETSARKYMALNANSPNNTGMRLLMLVDGAGVAAVPAQVTP